MDNKEIKIIRKWKILSVIEKVVSEDETKQKYSANYKISF